MNPGPSLQGALWSGNQQLATKRQLLSSIAGVYTDLQDLSGFSFQNIEVSTLTAAKWISAPVLYVSSIVGASIDISGITISEDGVFNAPVVSLSSLSFKGFDNLLDLDVSFDLGLGDAIGGLAAGLGALVGGAAIAVGTGVGLTIQGAEQGLATMVAGRPQNFISQTNYETINFTTQLQVSTLGNAYPLYSTITRTVSSISANQVPGPEIFVSSFFLPGQICIRSVSDPFNLITGDSNLNTSTIQSFGQWVALEGLEPENIVANGVVANTISTGEFYSILAKTDVLESYTVVASNYGVALSMAMNYQAPLSFQTGATNQAAFVGNLNNLYCYNTTGYIFSSDTGGGLQENASLFLGSNANESLFNLSTINAVGDIKSVNMFASTITCEQLNVISTIFLTSTNIEVITSTQTINADTAFIKDAFISTLDSFTFTTGLGNPIGPYDISKTDSVISTQYTNISSLTQNILSYTLNAKIQDQTIIYPWSPTAEIYTVSPNNVGQWASTMLYCNPGADIGGELAMTYPSSFFTVGMTGQFDLTVDMTTNPFSMSAVQYQNDNPGGGILNTFFYTPPTTGYLQTYRFTLAPTGIWSAASPAPPSPVTENSNVFTISQTITDTYIRATDRLHLQAGDILLDGTLNIPTINIDTLNVDLVNATQISPFIQSNSTWGPGSTPPNMIQLNYAANIGSVSSLTSTNTQIMTYAQAGYINNYTSYISTTVSRPSYIESFGTGNAIYFGPLGATGFNAGPGVYNRPDINWAFGTFTFTAADSNLTIDFRNFGSLATNGPILNLSNAGSFAARITLQGIAGTTLLPPNTGTTILWNQTVFFPPTIYTPWAPYVITDDFQINQSFQNVEIDTNNAFFTGNVTASSNLAVSGTSQLTGQITTFVPSAGFAGIEFTQQDESVIVWSFVEGAGATWESASQNLIPRAAGGYYKTTDWDCILSIQEWTTPDTSTQQNSFMAKPVNQAVGGVNYYAIYRYLVLIHIGAPSSGTFVVNVMMVPKNLTT